MSAENGTSATPEEYRLEFIKKSIFRLSNEVKKLNKVVGDHATSLRYHDSLNRRARTDPDALKSVANEHHSKLEYLRSRYRVLIVFAVVNAVLVCALSIHVYFK